MKNKCLKLYTWAKTEQKTPFWTWRRESKKKGKNMKGKNVLMKGEKKVYSKSLNLHFSLDHRPQLISTI